MKTMVKVLMQKMLMVTGMMTKGQSGTDHPLVGADVIGHKTYHPNYYQMMQPDDMNT